jgi:chemotaxis protein histidine kinase CheA
VSLWKYVKAAFKNHWNMLAFFGASAFSVLTGRPDIGLPLVAAAELTYLGLLSTHEKFQKSVDAQEAKAKRQTSRLSAEEALERITAALPKASLNRYEALHARIATLREIAKNLRVPGGTDEPRPLESIQLRGLDRLLWVYLRLLYTEHSLGRFLSHTNDAEIRSDIERLTRKLAGYAEVEKSPRRQKARKAVEDSLATAKSRLQNLKSAHENLELVQLELERLEHKIRSIGEMAVNRQEPQVISEQVDSVTESMIETEKTMDELEFATGLGEVDEAVPELSTRKSILKQR